MNSYHAWFTSFLEINHSILAECGANDLRIFMEVFYAEGQQCSLEIFDRETLSFIGKYDVALPISVYALSEKTMTEWVEQIKKNWRSV